MGRTKKVDDETTQQSVDIDELDEGEQDIVAAIGELEGVTDSRWQVTRVAPLAPGKSAGFCDSFSSAEISKDAIRKAFGRGRYRVRGIRPDGTFIKHFTVDIATDPPTDAPAPIVASKEPSDILGVLQLMEDRRTKNRNELLTILSPIIAAAIPTFFNRRESGGGVKDAIELAAAMKALNGGTDQGAVLDTMFKAMEFARDSAGGGKSDSWVDVAKDAISSLAPMLGAKMGTPAPTPTPQHVPQLAAPVAQPSTQAVQSEGDNMILMKLIPWAKSSLKYLADKAKRNGDPDLYAEWLLDNPPMNGDTEIDIAPFMQYLEHADWWQYLQQFSPDVAPYQGWFTQLRDALIDLWEERTATEQLGGNADNAATAEE